MARLVSFFVLIGIVVLFAFLSMRVLASFLLPLFIAVMLVVMFRPLHNWFVRHCRGHNHLAAGLTTMAILLIVLLPLGWVLLRAATELTALVGTLDQDNLVAQLGRLQDRLDLEPPPPAVTDALEPIQGTLARLRRADDVHRSGDLEDLQTWADELAKALQRWPNEQPDAQMPYQPPPAAVAAAHELLVERLAAVAEQAQQPDADQLAQAVSVAERQVLTLRETLYGGPIMQLIKTQLNIDKRQVVSSVREQLNKAVAPLALGVQFLAEWLLELIVGLVIMVVALYYFLADGPAMLMAVMRLTPLDTRYEAQLLDEFSALTRAIIVAMLLAAFVQGLLAGVGYFFVGFNSLFLLTIITMLCAMVPFFGATLIWGSCCLWLFAVDGRPMAAIGLAVYCTLVVSMADNVIKPYVLHGRSNLHPLLGLLSVLGGAKALGPIGLVVGPMVVALLQTVLVMLRNELESLDRDKPEGEQRHQPTASPLSQTLLAAATGQSVSAMGDASDSATQSKATSSAADDSTESPSPRSPKPDGT